MDVFHSISPLKFLEKNKSGGLCKGNLGIIIARAGVGKTACLIHIAFDKIFRNEKLVHISLESGPEKITAYYKSIYYDLIKVLGLTDENDYRERIDKNRMILAYLNQSFTVDRLCENLRNLKEKLDFTPDTLIVDGLDFENAERSLFAEFKDIARELDVEIWFSALSHRHITEVNERGIPYPCRNFDDLFTVIIQLQPDASGISLRLLKDHDNVSVSDTGIRLDTNTFSVIKDADI